MGPAFGDRMAGIFYNFSTYYDACSELTTVLEKLYVCTHIFNQPAAAAPVWVRAGGQARRNLCLSKGGGLP
jgi:hypothetical protein